MTKQQLAKAIIKVAESTGEGVHAVSAKLEAKDSWAWFLVREAAK